MADFFEIDEQDLDDLNGNNLKPEIVDLILVHHIADYTDKKYLFKAPVGETYINQIVSTKKDAKNLLELDRAVARVLAIYPSIEIGSMQYYFICKVAGIKEVTKYISSKYLQESISVE